MLLPWSDKYSIGIAEIDKQHQTFFEAAHRLHDAIMNSAGEKVVEETLQFLKDYVVKHFQDEEALMQRYDYPGLEDHKKLHVDFLDTFDEFTSEWNVFLAPSQDLADRLLATTQDWLIEHIAESDTLYAQHIKRST